LTLDRDLDAYTATAWRASLDRSSVYIYEASHVYTMS
jgi:hypothetical protein